MRGFPCNTKFLFLQHPASRMGPIVSMQRNGLDVVPSLGYLGESALRLQVWACIFVNKIIPMPKHEHFPRQAARLDKMWLTCTSVSQTLVVQALHCTQMEIKKLI